MEDHERRSLVEQLTESRGRLLSVVDGLTSEQWRFHPSQERWSISDCLEHVTRVENRIIGLIEQKMEQPPEPAKEDAGSKDSLLKRRVPDRSERRQAPEVARPTGAWADPDELKTEFQRVRERTTAFASTIEKDLRRHFIPHGLFGELDCYQWLLVLSLHGERHACQMEEVMRDPSFPKKG